MHTNTQPYSNTQSTNLIYAVNYCIVPNLSHPYLELLIYSVPYPYTGYSMPYKGLIKFGGTQQFWSTDMCKDLRRTTQEHKTTTETNIIFLNNDGINNTPANCTST